MIVMPLIIQTFLATTTLTKYGLLIMLNFRCALVIAIVLKLHQNWRRELAPAPLATRLVAFTLIEISIVLVIIGLIVGGIVLGIDLVRAAQIRSMASDVERIKIATTMFKDLFRQMPGDSDKMWGIYGTSCASSSAECNGNNNRNICQQYDYTGCGNKRGEDSCALHHLTLAGVWEETTTSSAACTASTGGISRTMIAAYPGVVVSTIDGKYLHIAAWNMYQNGYRNAVTLTAPSINFGGAYMNAADPAGPGNGVSLFTAHTIDTKFDDGQPASGKIWVSASLAIDNCVAPSWLYSNPASTVKWYSNLNITGGRCQVHFWLD